MAGDDLMKSETGASATDVFDTLPKEELRKATEPVRPVPPVVPAVASVEPATAVSSAGFTQLLRALNFDQVKAPEKATVADQPASGNLAVPGMRTIVDPEAGTQRSVAPVVSAQVTSFLPQSTPVMPASAPPPQAEGSFTQLFHQLEEPSSDIAGTPPVSASASRPGSFTQLFARVDAESSGVESLHSKAASNQPVEMSRHPAEPMVERASVERTEDRDTSAANSQGSFTQMFERPDTRASESVSVPATATTPVGAEDAPGRPGSFTQIFQTFGETAPEQPKQVVRPTVDKTSEAEPGRGHGSFTQMFQTLERPAEASTKSEEQKPGSFTQLFSTVAGLPPEPVPAPANVYERPFTAGVPDSAEPYQDHRPAFSPMESASMGRPPVGNTPAQGGITQLLQRLDQPSQAPQPFVPSAYPLPAAKATAPQPGSFTGVYEGLGMPVTPPATPIPSAAVPIPSATGPSEFTRIQNASALREGTLRDGASAEGAASAGAAETSAAGSGRVALPGGLQAMPHASFSAQTLPQASVSGLGGAHGAVSAAGGGQASLSGPSVPHVPAMPQMKLPQASKAATPAAGVQKYLPLLLILVIFLLLAVLVAVVFFIKK